MIIIIINLVVVLFSYNFNIFNDARSILNKYKILKRKLG